MMVIVNWGCSEPRDILLKIQMAGVTSVTGFRWTEKPPRPKLPFATAMKDGRPFTFAGLWERVEGTRIWRVVASLARLSQANPMSLLRRSIGAVAFSPWEITNLHVRYQAKCDFLLLM